MDFLNKFGNTKELDAQVGDPVEIIIRSSLYCSNNERPLYEFGTLTEIVYEDFGDGTFPVGVYILQEEEKFILFSEVEEVFVREYDIAGYSKLNEGMTLSVKGNGVGKIFWFFYINGSLIPKYVSEMSLSDKQPLSEQDHELLKEIRKYGAYQSFSHFVFSQSK